MNDQPIRFGALSLLFLVVAICLVVLGVLSFTTARANIALASKQADVVTQNTANDALGQEWLASVDAMLAEAQANGGREAYIASHLPAGTSFAGSSLWANLGTGGKYALAVEVTIDSDLRYTITKWETTVDWTRDESIGNVWSGA